MILINGMLISDMLSSIHDWDAEDHEQDCESTMQRRVTLDSNHSHIDVPVNHTRSVDRINFRECHIIYNYTHILTCRLTTHAPSIEYKEMSVFHGFAYYSHFLYLKREFCFSTFKLILLTEHQHVGPFR